MARLLFLGVAALAHISRAGPPDLPGWTLGDDCFDAYPDGSETSEVAGPAGTSLNGMKAVIYQASDGKVWKARDLSGVIPNDSNGRSMHFEQT